MTQSEISKATKPALITAAAIATGVDESKIKGTVKQLRGALTLHYFPPTEEESKTESVKLSKAAKKAVKTNDANILAMGAIRALVASGSEAVTYKENATGSVLWVKTVESCKIKGLDNAVLSNIKKSVACQGASATCSSFTLAASGYRCLHIHAN